MSYVDKHLLPGEKVTYRTKLHWRVYIGPGVIVLAIVLLTAWGLSQLQSNKMVLVAAAVILSGALLLTPWLHRRSSEFAVTNKRVVIKLGVFSIRSIELLLQKIEGIEVQQSFLGRILGFGEILVKGTGGTQEAFDGIQSPLDFRQAVQAATDGIG